MSLRNKIKHFKNRKIPDKITGNPLLDYYNSQLTTNNFSKRKINKLTELELRKITNGLDYSDSFRTNSNYLRFLVNDDSNQTPISNNNGSQDLELRSLEDTIGPGNVLPDDGQSYLSRRWYTETSNWIMRGNKNINNSYDPVPCALPPVHDLSDGSETCSRYLEKVIDDGNEIITMADWSHILCEENPSVYCQELLIPTDCQMFCGNRPTWSEIQTWYDDWFMWWYSQEKAWSKAGWSPYDYYLDPPSKRSPLFTSYIYQQNHSGEYLPYLDEFDYRWPDGINRKCGPGYAIFPATATLLNPENLDTIINNQHHTWVIKTAEQAYAECSSSTLCGECPIGQSCIISVEESYCSGDSPTFASGDTDIYGNDYQYPTMNPHNELSDFYDGTALGDRTNPNLRDPNMYYPSEQEPGALE